MTNPQPIAVPDPAAPRSGQRTLAAARTVVRFLLGLAFVVFGVNGFLNFLPQPTTPLPAGAIAFATALMKTGYMLQLIAVTQLTVGVLLVLNRFVPLALVLLAPFMVNSVLFHWFLEPSGRPMSFGVLACLLFLAWCYRDAYRPLLTARWPARPAPVVKP